MSRVIALYRTVARYRLDQLLPAKQRPDCSHYFARLSRAIGACDYSPGERLRRAMEDLGPVFIKFGQLLSTRRDLLTSRHRG
jgi:ubiquinone biosynthesis protein